MATSGAEDREYLILRRQAAQPRFDVATLAEEIATLLSDEAPRRIFLDWSSVKSWPFAAPSRQAIACWSMIVPPIRRVAIVHAPKWNQHAALLSALLRLSGAEVRSFHPRQHAGAAAWLKH